LLQIKRKIAPMLMS